MRCPRCKLELGENTPFCPICGTDAKNSVQSADQPLLPPAPEQKLMSPWAYVGWQLLFSIPLVGLILLIIFSFDDSNLNRRNFARSYWCALLIALVLCLFVVILLVTLGVNLAEFGGNIPKNA